MILTLAVLFQLAMPAPDSACRHAGKATCAAWRSRKPDSLVIRRPTDLRPGDTVTVCVWGKFGERWYLARRAPRVTVDLTVTPWRVVRTSTREWPWALCDGTAPGLARARGFFSARIRTDRTVRPRVVR